MKYFYSSAAALTIVVLLLQACAFLGVPTPATFNQRAAFALSQVTAVRESAAELVTARAITAEDARNIQSQATTARAGIDLAIGFHATDPNQAENRLLAAQIILDALKAYLTQEAQKEAP